MSFDNLDDCRRWDKEYDFYPESYSPIENHNLSSWYDEQDHADRELSIVNIDVRKGISREEAKMMMQLAEAANLVRVRTDQCTKMQAEIDVLRAMNNRLHEELAEYYAKDQIELEPTP